MLLSHSSLRQQKELSVFDSDNDDDDEDGMEISRFNGF